MLKKNYTKEYKELTRLLKTNVRQQSDRDPSGRLLLGERKK